MLRSFGLNITLVSALVLGSSPLWSVVAQDPSTDRWTEEQLAFFESKVLPTLQEKCYGCHSHATEFSGNLALDFASGWRQGGDRGPAIEVGNPDASLLIRAVDGLEDGLKMPPEESLTVEQISWLRHWIQEGAADPRQSPPLAKSEEPWWSLLPMRKVVPPTLDNITISPANPIDAFVEDVLAKHQVTGNEVADRRALLRRLTVDLHGLVPTMEELDAFVADSRPDAYERVVDQLLASPRYGERWARHWFDWIHFADSHGFEHDVMRMHAWRYRDYVISALNEDLSWTEWVEQQLAADALFPGRKDLIPALGFIAAGPWDQSTAATAQLTFDYQDRDDMVMQTMSVLASATVHCARCHNHKFDPITQSDYYALQAVFAGVGRGNVPFDADPSIARQRSEAEHWKKAAMDRDASILTNTTVDQAVTAWEQAYHQTDVRWESVSPSLVIATEGTTLTVDSERTIIASGVRPERETTVVSFETPLERLTGLRLDVFRHEELPMAGPGRNDNGNFHLSEIVVEHFRNGMATSTIVPIGGSSADFDQEGWTVAHAIDGNPKTAWGIHPQVSKDHTAIFGFREPISIAMGDRLVVQLKQWHGGFHTIGRFRLSVTASPLSSLVMIPSKIESILKLPTSERSPSDRIELASHVILEQSNRLLNGLPPADFVYAGSPAFENLPQSEFYKAWNTIKKVFVLRRGDISQPQEEAVAGALGCVSSLPSRFEIKPDAKESERRVALARWITDRANPLSWRSIVNRLWGQHFGHAIVDTPNDFGRMGSLPTHPELLDWLAVTLQENGGSLKRLHREMVLSEAYRRSSSPMDDGLAVDPENRWKWRGTRRRLDAETFRDSILHLAGRLDLSMGGPAVQWFRLGPAIQVTPSVDYSNYDWSRKDGNRRAVYRFVYRGQQDPLMELLDFPDAAQLISARTLTSSPLQALALWNHEFVLYACDALAQQIQHHAKEQGGDETDMAFQTIYLRKPTDEERKLTDAYRSKFSLAGLVRVLLNSSEFLYCD
ncbi:MAG: PSD1 and planctomycete cytochrome C domain-containing protein [Pirellula sp.]